MIDNKNHHGVNSKISWEIELLKKFQKEAGKFKGNQKLLKKNQQMITQNVKLLANKDNKDDKENRKPKMVKAVTDVLAQYGIVRK